MRANDRAEDVRQLFLLAGKALVEKQDRTAHDLGVEIARHHGTEVGRATCFCKETRNTGSKHVLAAARLSVQVHRTGGLVQNRDGGEPVEEILGALGPSQGAQVLVEARVGFVQRGQLAADGRARLVKNRILIVIPALESRQIS